MKNIIKLLSVASLAALSVASCNFPEYDITEEIKLERCLTPVQVTAKVQYVTATFDLKVFSDAENYELEIYNVVPEEGVEPASETLLEKFVLSPDDFPFSYLGPDETRCYYRLRAVSSERDASNWVTGTFLTDVDPTTMCSKPAQLACKSICQKVIYDWSTAPNVEIYEVEIYSKSIPSQGDPDAASLVKTEKIKVTDIPFSVKYTELPEGDYWFRVRGTAPTTGLKSSKWVNGGKLTLKVFAWPTSDEALNEYTKENFGTANSVGPFVTTTKDGKSYTNSVVEEQTYLKFTYAPFMRLWGDHVSYNATNASNLNTEYGPGIPKAYFISFKICKPGNFKCPISGAAGVMATIAVLTNKEGEGLKATYLLDKDGLPTTTSESKTNPVLLDITEDDLYGITEAATVYVFSSNGKGITTYAIEWTPDSKY